MFARSEFCAFLKHRRRSASTHAICTYVVRTYIRTFQLDVPSCVVDRNNTHTHMRHSLSHLSSSMAEAVTLYHLTSTTNDETKVQFSNERRKKTISFSAISIFRWRFFVRFVSFVNRSSERTNKQFQKLIQSICFFLSFFCIKIPNDGKFQCSRMFNVIMH